MRMSPCILIKRVTEKTERQRVRVCIHTGTYLFIYIHRERGREREKKGERQRERERARDIQPVDHRQTARQLPQCLNPITHTRNWTGSSGM